MGYIASRGAREASIGIVRYPPVNYVPTERPFVEWLIQYLGFWRKCLPSCGEPQGGLFITALSAPSEHKSRNVIKIEAVSRSVKRREKIVVTHEAKFEQGSGKAKRNMQEIEQSRIRDSDWSMVCFQ